VQIKPTGKPNSWWCYEKTGRPPCTSTCPVTRVRRTSKTHPIAQHNKFVFSTFISNRITPIWNRLHKYCFDCYTLRKISDLNLNCVRFKLYLMDVRGASSIGTVCCIMFFNCTNKDSDIQTFRYSDTWQHWTHRKRVIDGIND
jgi:hypothetical protein